ncbi:MAG: hypothetical protein ORN98_05100, partial [Alphaproteobacteria bacterium]|nr:hypothetical protein [Alphaproteobacteria bacterium]
MTGNSITLENEGDWVEIVAVSLSSTNGRWLVNAAGAALPRKLADAAYSRAITDAYTAAIAADKKAQLPVGSVIFTACTIAPAGWLMCDDGFIGPSGTTWSWAQSSYGIGAAHTGSAATGCATRRTDQNPQKTAPRLRGRRGRYGLQRFDKPIYSLLSGRHGAT